MTTPGPVQKLGLLYVGVDVSARQVQANRLQAEAICADCEYQPLWIVGDGEHIAELLAAALTERGLPSGTRADFLLTCPPVRRPPPTRATRSPH